MSIKDRLIAGREKAFKKLDAMAVDVVFRSKDALRYDYLTGGTTHTSLVTTTTRAFMVPVEEEMGVGSNPVHKARSQLIVRTEDLTSTSYTTATIAGVVYHCRKTEDNILVTILELSDVQ